MTNSDVISIIALILSLVNIILLFIFSRWQNKTYESSLETQIRTDMNTIIFEMQHLATSNLEVQNSLFQSAYFTAEEKYRNAYEDLCQKYITRKIDKNWVEKMYKEEIKKLVEDEKQSKFYSTIQSQYLYTKKVYEKWFKKV